MDARPQNQWLTYRDLASVLVEYVKRMGYTHVELMPVMEHPFPDRGAISDRLLRAHMRFGTPDDFRYFVDHCHQAGVA